MSLFIGILIVLVVLYVLLVVEEKLNDGDK
jgi:hypothetical protein